MQAAALFLFAPPAQNYGIFDAAPSRCPGIVLHAPLVFHGKIRWWIWGQGFILTEMGKYMIENKIIAN
jgi:hypothetical protein